MVMEDLTCIRDHRIEHTDNMLQNCTSETYIILLTNVTPINSIKIKNMNKNINIWKKRFHRDMNLDGTKQDLYFP